MGARVALVVGLVVAVAACGGGGGDDDTPAGSPNGTTTEASSPAQPNHDGQWFGTTSQDKSISFSVTDGALTSISVEYEVPRSQGCTLLSGSFEKSSFETPIVDGKFTEGGTDGEFTSRTTASGTYDSGPFSPPHDACEQFTFTWEAECKQGECAA